MDMRGSAILDELEVCEVQPGWDTVQGYLLINTRLGIGNRVPAPDKHVGSWQLLAFVHYAVYGWLPVELGESIRQSEPETGWRWPDLHLVTDTHGVSSALVGVAERAFPTGWWCQGSYPGMDDNMPWLLARMVDGKVVAIVAPAERADT